MTEATVLLYVTFILATVTCSIVLLIFGHVKEMNKFMVDNIKLLSKNQDVLQKEIISSTTEIKNFDRDVADGLNQNLVCEIGGIRTTLMKELRK